MFDQVIHKKVDYGADIVDGEIEHIQALPDKHKLKFGKAL